MEDFNSKYSGEQVEALLDQVASGNAGGGGGGGIAVETDPIFSASPAASITEADKQAWSGKQDAISDLESIRDGASKGATAVQPEDVAGIVTDEGFVTTDDLAKVATSGSYNDLSFKPTFKTINNESIEGSGNITISGGSGEVGPQGDKGDKGDKGDTGVGVQSVKQTTTSNVDSGYNVVTVTLTDGTTSTFSVKNGSKGSTGANGTNGVSVSSVKQTTISSADGGTNVVTVTLSNGTTSTFNVKNGSKGSNGTNGTNGKDGADGEDGATFTPSVDSAGNLSWSNNKGLANPPTVNIKGPKGDKGDAGEGGGGSSGGGVPVIAVTIHQGELSFSEHTIPLEPDKIYYANESTEMVYIFVVTPPTGDVGKYSVHFTTTSMVLGFECPQNWLWANGTTPTLEPSTTYELSVVAIKFGDDYIYKAVLTPFKTL